ncbi:MAG TPA: translesion error-prone DNA polymerase V autoproteolytic subunit [Cytophaga sp.]|jgi:DNA polymerase V|nr:translesion error-prone DNA polymerase V autoproteolytic subunit [Cytophaga sp.]
MQIFHTLPEALHAPIPLADGAVAAGFPSPAGDYIDNKIDIFEYLVQHPIATFYVRVKGNSMINASIHDGDLLVVDRSIEPRNNQIVVAIIDGEFTVKRISKYNNKLYLIPENEKFKPMEITENMGFEVWGVVTFVIHKP